MDIKRKSEEPLRIAAVRENVPMADLTAFFARTFAHVDDALRQAGATPDGAPVAIYFGSPGAEVDVAAGYILRQATPAPTGTDLIELAGGPALEGEHVGRYDDLGSAYEEIEKAVSEQGLVRAPLMWEQYLRGPDASPDPSTWRTRIVYPLA